MFSKQNMEVVGKKKATMRGWVSEPWEEERNQNKGGEETSGWGKRKGENRGEKGVSSWGCLLPSRGSNTFKWLKESKEKEKRRKDRKREGKEIGGPG